MKRAVFLLLAMLFFASPSRAFFGVLYVETYQRLEEDGERYLFWKRGDRIYQSICFSWTPIAQCSPENSPVIFDLSFAEFMDFLSSGDRLSQFDPRLITQVEEELATMNQKLSAFQARVEKVRSIDPEAADLLWKESGARLENEINWKKGSLSNIKEVQKKFFFVLESERVGNTGNFWELSRMINQFGILELSNRAFQAGRGLARYIREHATPFVDHSQDRWAILSEEPRATQNNKTVFTFGPTAESKLSNPYSSTPTPRRELQLTCESVFGKNWHLPAAKQLLLARSELKKSPLGAALGTYPVWTNEIGHCDVFHDSCNQAIMIDFAGMVGGWWAVQGTNSYEARAVRVCVCEAQKDCAAPPVIPPKSDQRER